MHQSQHIQLRLLLTCFYIYFNCHNLLNIKQVIFHYSLLSSPFIYPYTYIHILSIASNCTILFYRFLLLYALWHKFADLFLISIVFLGVLICLRSIFDFYDYYSGLIKQSLYYPFDSFDIKSMTKEIIDLVFLFIQNSFGLVLSIYMFKDIIIIINNNRSTRLRREVSHQSSILGD